MLSKKTIGCIGTGNMGSAIISGLSSNLNKEKIVAFDVNNSALESVKLKYDINIADNITDLTKKSDVIIIAVKPDIVSIVVNELKDVAANKVIISIAAGITISSIEDIIRSPQSIIRVMPNTPALIGEGISVLAPNNNVDDESLDLVKDIFGFLGNVMILPEKLMDAVTAVSGCGPAYCYTLIQAMTDGGVKSGIPRDEALKLSAQTIYGAAAMVLQSGEEPIILRGKVASPGGSTIEAIHTLERSGFSGIVMDAIESAKIKSEELGKS